MDATSASWGYFYSLSTTSRCLSFYYIDSRLLKEDFMNRTFLVCIINDKKMKICEVSHFKLTITKDFIQNNERAFNNNLYKTLQSSEWKSTHSLLWSYWWLQLPKTSRNLTLGNWIYLSRILLVSLIAVVCSSSVVLSNSGPRHNSGLAI